MSKRSRTIRSASPRYLEPSVEEVTEKKVVPHSVASAWRSSPAHWPTGGEGSGAALGFAIALASSVLPVPHLAIN